MNKKLIKDYFLFSENFILNAQNIFIFSITTIFYFSFARIQKSQNFHY